MNEADRKDDLLRHAYELLRRYARLNTGGSDEAARLADRIKKLTKVKL